MREERDGFFRRWRLPNGRKKKFSWIIFILLMMLPILLILVIIHARTSMEIIEGVHENDSLLSGIGPESKESLTREMIITTIRVNETERHLEDLENELNTIKINLEQRLTSIESVLANIIGNDFNTSSSNDDNSEFRARDVNCKLVFTISSAHSGGDYLHDIFSNIPEVMSYYRSPPPMSGDDLLLVKTMGLDSTFHTRFKKKIPSIESQLLPGKTWFDGSHLFIESWYDVAMEHFYEKQSCDVRVIVLRRYWPHVLQSLLQEGFSKYERNLYHSYTSKIALLPPAPLEIQRYKAHEQIIWYLLDIEKQIEHFKYRYPNVPIIYSRIESLTTPRAFSKLLHMLDIPIPPKLLEYENAIEWNDVNFSVPLLETPVLPADLEYQYVETFKQVVSEYEKQGISFGELTALEKIIS